MTWATFRAVTFRATLTFFDSACGVLIGGGLFALNVAIWKAALVAGLGGAITVVRNYLGVLTPSGVPVPTTLPPGTPGIAAPPAA